MKPMFPILALSVVFAATGAVAEPRGHNIILSPPAVVTSGTNIDTGSGG